MQYTKERCHGDCDAEYSAVPDAGDACVAVQVGEGYGCSCIYPGISGHCIDGNTALYPAAGESDRCFVAGFVDLFSDEGGAEFDSFRAVLCSYVDRDGHRGIGCLGTAAGVQGA